MSIYQIKQRHKRKRTDWLLSALLLLACLFAQCVVHAENQSRQFMASAQLDDEHDCCEPEVDCCGAPELTTNSTGPDIPFNALTATFIGLGELMTTRYFAVFGIEMSDAVPTGPPIHLVNCRFTL
jgi:hypothetical protein